jgi:hypothetical protein
MEECRRLLDASTDPLEQDVYRAMLDEFGEKIVAARLPLEAISTRKGENRRRYRERRSR